MRSQRRIFIILIANHRKIFRIAEGIIFRPFVQPILLQKHNTLRDNALGDPTNSASGLLFWSADNAMSSVIKSLVIDKSGIPLLKRYLDLSSLKHKLVAGNIANVSTPGFKSKDVDFHGELQKFVGGKERLKGRVTHPAHLPIGADRKPEPEILVNKSREGNGINNVDIDKEVANLAQNQIYYSLGARLLAQKFQGLRNAIKSK